MAKLNTALILTAALTVAGCASAPKNVAVAPPSVTPPPPTVQQAPVQQPSGPAPGSAADFKASTTSDTIHFALDKFDIDPESRAILDTQAAWLLKYPSVRATIEGHCDERGTREYNLALGDRRANAAKNYLAARGIDAGRLTTISYGKERPIALGSDEASWAQNRRAVTIVIGS